MSLLKKTACLLVLFCFPMTGFCQSVTQVSPGLAGEKDARGRNPELYVTRVHNGETISLQVDAHVPHEDYRQYPIQFEFYINRQFFTSQLRSSELPGPIGIDIGPDVATPPFNYAVLARVLHPHRSTHSMVVGAVYNQEMSVSLTCNVSWNGDEYTAEDVTTSQAGDDQFSVNFKATKPEVGSINVVGLVVLNGSSANSLVEVIDGGETAQYNTSGTATLNDNSLASFALSSPDESFTVNCE